MKSHKTSFNSNQLLFKELFVGTLIYAVVLGFFDDYTSLVDALSFSTIFFAAIVLEVLTYLAFLLKGEVVSRFKMKQGFSYRFLMFFLVWLVLFFSKFVFIWIVDKIFGSYITINGFFGILALVFTVTLAHKLADTVFEELGKNKELA